MTPVAPLIRYRKTPLICEVEVFPTQALWNDITAPCPEAIDPLKLPALA